MRRPVVRRGEKRPVWPKHSNVEKLQNPNNKSQTNLNLQITNACWRTGCFGHCCLGFVWNLELGIWDFVNRFARQMHAAHKLQ